MHWKLREAKGKEGHKQTGLTLLHILNNIIKIIR